MKKYVAFIVCVFMLALTPSYAIYAEQIQNTSGEEMIDASQRQYDSVYFSDDEINNYSLKKEYNYLIHEFGDADKASLEYGFDVELLNDNSDLLKIYVSSEHDIRKDILDGKAISDIANGVSDFKYVKALNDETVVWFEKGDDYITYANITEEDYYSYLIGCYNYVFEAKSICETVEAIKPLGDINILQVYTFIGSYDIHDWLRPLITYYITDKGDFVLYSHDTYPGNDYLLPSELFCTLTKKMYDREAFYDSGETESQNRIDIYTDLSTYLVGENKFEPPTFCDKYPFLKNDPNFKGYQSKYHFAKGIGLNKASQLRDTMMQMDPAYEGAFINGGLLKEDQLSWGDFLQTLADAGCTTYDECRAYIDDAIEARKNPPPDTEMPSDSDSGTTDTPESPDKGGNYRFLIWLIPSVLAVLAAAVAILILKKKKKV